jgi:uncharacterized protein YjiS (DUF1127 family)
MPCAGPNYSCNSLLSIRSPFGEIRLGAPDSAKPAARPIWPVIKAYRASREALAHRRQRQSLRVLDTRLLRDIGLTRADVDGETRGSRRRLLDTLRAGAEWFVHQRLKCAARELNQSVIDRAVVTNPEAVHEIRKLFGLSHRE